MADSKKIETEYEEGYRKGKDTYKDREGSKVEKFLTENVSDPLDKAIFGSKDKEYVEGYKKARKEKLGFKKGGAVKSSASRRADGCAVRGKTRGKMV